MPENNITIPKLRNRHIEHPPIENYRLVCYYSFPTQSCDLDKQLSYKKLDPDLCTHINIGFANIENNTIHLTDYYKNVTKQVLMLKSHNKNLKVLLSVGGAGGSGFTEMVVNHANRKM